MIRQAALIIGMCFIAAPTMCSDFTKAFSTTKFSTGFCLGTLPFVTAQMFKKVAHHAISPHHTIAFAAGSVASSLSSSN